MPTVFLFYIHFLNSESFTKDQLDRMFEPITSKYGIRIIYQVGDNFFSDLADPIIPAGPAPNSKVTPIRHRVLARYPRILKNALDKYPSDIIKKHLNTIQFAGEIDAGGFKYGGTHDPFRRIIYLVDDGSKNDHEAMSTFHHEMSSLILKKHSFFINPWTDQNPKGFKYLREVYDTWEDLQKKVDISNNYKEDYKKGFLNTYSQTNFENDFNEYSAMIFTYPEKFKKIMDQYPRVRGKFLIWLDFYHKIDPIFSEDYLLGTNRPTSRMGPPRPPRA
jgi:hypothetical protein